MSEKVGYLVCDQQTLDRYGNGRFQTKAEGFLDVDAVLENGDTKRMKVQIMDEGQRVLSISESGSGGDLEYAELSRHFGGCTLIASQSIAALVIKSARGTAFEKIYGVIRSIGTFGTSDPKTIQYMQQIAGKHTVEKKSRTVSENKSSPRMDALTEEYGSDTSSLSLSYTVSEALEDRIQAKDISEADPFTSIVLLYDGLKNNITNNCIIKNY